MPEITTFFKNTPGPPGPAHTAPAIGDPRGPPQPQPRSFRRPPPIFSPISAALRATARLAPSRPGPGRCTGPGPPGRLAPGSAYRPPWRLRNGIRFSGAAEPKIVEKSALNSPSDNRHLTGLRCSFGSVPAGNTQARIKVPPCRL